MDYAALIVLGLVAIYFIMAVRIANENERFAVFTIGRFIGLKGPGLMLKLPGGATDFVRVALGAEGEVQSNELVLIGGRAIRYTSKDPVRSGARVRVSGFDAGGVKVEPLQRIVVCEKCGHKNVL